jgi:hypothetical protein
MSNRENAAVPPAVPRLEFCSPFGLRFLGFGTFDLEFAGEAGRRVGRAAHDAPLPEGQAREAHAVTSAAADRNAGWHVQSAAMGVERRRGRRPCRSLSAVRGLHSGGSMGFTGGGSPWDAVSR